MSSDPRERSNSTVLILSIVGGIVLVVVLACAGVGYLVVLGMRGFQQAMSSAMQMATDVQNSMMAAQTFLDDVAEGRLDEAYSQTTKEYRERVKREQFQALLEKNPAFRKATHDLNTTNFNTSTHRFTATFTNPDGITAACTLQLKKDGEEWKIDRFSVGNEGDAALFAKEQSKANQQAKDFLNDIGAGKLDAAYARTTQDYRDGTSADRFRALVGKHAGLKGFTKQDYKTVNAEPAQTTFTVTLSGPTGKLTCTLQLVDEDGAWKVERFTVP